MCWKTECNNSIYWTRPAAKIARGKYLSFEEARKSGEMNQFGKEHPIEDVHPQVRSRFKRLLEAATKGLLVVSA